MFEKQEFTKQQYGSQQFNREKQYESSENRRPQNSYTENKEYSREELSRLQSYLPKHCFQQIQNTQQYSQSQQSQVTRITSECKCLLDLYYLYNRCITLVYNSEDFESDDYDSRNESELQHVTLEVTTNNCKSILASYDYYIKHMYDNNNGRSSNYEQSNQETNNSEIEY